MVHAKSTVEKLILEQRVSNKVILHQNCFMLSYPTIDISALPWPWSSFFLPPEMTISWCCLSRLLWTTWFASSSNDDCEAIDELVEASDEEEDIVESLICSAAVKIMSYLGTFSLINSSKNFSFSGYAGDYTGLRWETRPLKVLYFSSSWLKSAIQRI